MQFQSPTEYPHRRGGWPWEGEVCLAVVTAVTHPVPLRLDGSSQLSGPALSWPRARTSLSPSLPASSTNSRSTDAEASVTRRVGSLPQNVRLFHATPLGRGQGREDAGSQGAGGCSSESRKENWAGRRTGSCHGRDAAGSVFVTGLGGVNSKALTDGGTMSPHFPNSP